MSTGIVTLWQQTPAHLLNRLQQVPRCTPTSAARFDRRRAQRGNVLITRAAPQADLEAPSRLLQSLPEGERLADWVRSNGGYVHPSLALSDLTDCSARGIVTREPIQGDDAQLPLVLVPESLYLTASAADGLLSPALQDADRPPLRDSLNAGLSVAALLAHQRQEGPDAFYAPYVECLPAQPPCPWLLPSDQLEAAVCALGLGWMQQRRWMAEARAAADHARQQSRAAAEALAPVYDLDPDDIAWGMAQIASRAFGGFQDPGLAPFIDLMNHANEAQHPLGVEDDDNLPAGGVHYTVFSLWKGEPRELAAGQELYTSYLVLEHGMSPLNVFLNFGSEIKVPAQLHWEDDGPDGKPPERRDSLLPGWAGWKRTAQRVLH